jgi:glycosyltransferase involved in cell wall biosynthesis
MGPLRILQLSNRHLAYGGEEAMVRQMTAALSEFCSLTPFETSSESLLQNRLALPLRVFRNPEVEERLLGLHRTGSFHAWQAHTLLPGMSTTPYEVAFHAGVPLLQFLHNYRFSCTNGMFLDHGQPCQRCIQGNFVHAFRAGCWRNSRLASGWMGLVLHRLRSMGVLEKITRWIAPSEAVRTLHVQMGVPGERIDVVPHFLVPGPEPIPTQPRTPTALFVGRLSEEKGVLQLLQAWRLLDRSDARLLIAGEGPERPRLEAFARQESLHNVRFLGFVAPENQADLWGEAAVSVVPSIVSETFGLVVLEAWARARPVIAHRIGALPELVVPGTGWLADPGDPAHLAAQISAAFDSPEQTMAMGRTGHARLLSEFNKALWQDRMRNVYRRAGLTVGFS